jgi:hypothetical protein
MKKGYILAAVFIAGFCLVLAFAQTEPQQNTNRTSMNVGPGMQVVKHGNISVIVPKGASVRQEGGQLMIEDIGDYTGRRFEEMDQRLAVMEETQAELREKIDQLAQAIEDLTSGNVTTKH